MKRGAGGAVRGTRVLGEGQVVRDGRVLASSDWKAAMARGLAIHILVHGPPERDAIGAVCWPALTTTKMRNGLYATLHRMHGAVGAEAAVVENGVSSEKRGL
jgi:DNA-binding SARP family transcriptional activator